MFNSMCRSTYCTVFHDSLLIYMFLQCVEKFGEQWENVEGCVNGEKGESILKHMGDMTHSLNPQVTFIPTILIDGVSINFYYVFNNFLPMRNIVSL